jgi:hypothetical protein
VVIIAAAVALATYARQHRLPGTITGAGPASSTGPGSLRATAMTGHVTGPVPGSYRHAPPVTGSRCPTRPAPRAWSARVVGQANPTATICRSGYTFTVRPPESDTEAFKTPRGQNSAAVDSRRC